MTKKRIIISACVAIAVAAGSLYALRASSGSVKKDTTYLSEQVRRRDISATVQATGVIRAKIGAEVKVGARISGRVERLYANIGDVVKKGQVIARLEQDDLRARVNEEKMKLKVVDASLELAAKNLQRMETLHARGYISRDTVDVAQRDHKAALAQSEQLRESIRFNETQMSYATIVAPISGVIASVATQQGETVSASSLNVPTFVTIVDLNRLEVYAYVDETDIGKVRSGLEATFTVDSFPDRDFKGKVTAIYPKANIQDNVVYYITVVSIDDPGGVLKPDMTVSATLYLNKRENVLAVPNRAIKREGGKKVVYALENGRQVQKVIRTGWKDGAFTEVVEGIREGAQVVTGEAPKQEKD